MQVRKHADRSLEILVDTEPAEAEGVQKLKFKLFNAEWLEAVGAENSNSGNVPVDADVDEVARGSFGDGPHIHGWKGWDVEGGGGYGRDAPATPLQPRTLTSNMFQSPGSFKRELESLHIHGGLGGDAVAASGALDSARGSEFNSNSNAGVELPDDESEGDFDEGTMATAHYIT